MVRRQTRGVRTSLAIWNGSRPKMEKYGSKSGKTSKVIRIIECGEIDEALEKDEDDGDVAKKKKQMDSPRRRKWKISFGRRGRMMRGQKQRRGW